MKPSIPKGTRDFSPVEMAKRNYIFNTIRSVFANYGFKQIETPSMENLSTLMGKYGDEGDKLLFKIQNSGDYFSGLTDEELLTTVQERTFRYFWDYAHPVSGLARERLGSGDTVTSGGSGFGIMAFPVAVERGFVTRADAAGRLLKIVNFLNSKADRFHGAFPHWLNGTTGDALPFSPKDNGGDIVETALLLQGRRKRLTLCGRTVRNPKKHCIRSAFLFKHLNANLLAFKTK